MLTAGSLYMLLGKGLVIATGIKNNKFKNLFSYCIISFKKVLHFISVEISLEHMKRKKLCVCWGAEICTNI